MELMSPILTTARLLLSNRMFSLLAKMAVHTLIRLINRQPLKQEQIFVPVHFKEGETI